MDSNSHARKQEANTYIYTDGEVVTQLTLYVGSDITHVCVDQSAEADDVRAGGEGIGNGDGVEHQQVEPSLGAMLALPQDVEIDGGVEDALMKEGIGEPMRKGASLVETEVAGPIAHDERQG